ncbi:MAG: WhiB family transcriptional regulator [Propionibacteriaceae bacterium]|nr:WhiB family transcriptional regulator [Propionibacteriaceae bacterium]
MTWQDRALCATAPTPDVFFPEAANTHAYTLAALSYCRACPVRDECLAAALDEEAGATRAYTFGIRGGMLPNARWRLAKEVA